MTADSRHRSLRFLVAYAFANAGGVIAFLPLLTLLLPLKVADLAGAERLPVLNLVVATGAIAASVSNIVFGIASDRSVAAGRSRRGWIGAGLVAMLAGYAAIDLATTAAALVGAVILWQVAINVLLAPLFALMADEVPDGQKGFAGGLLTLATPLASIVSALVAAMTMLDDRARYAMICAVVCACVLPLLATRPLPPQPLPASAPPPAAGYRDIALAWLARLLVQVAGNVLFVYLLFYFETIVIAPDRGALAAWVGRILILGFAIPLPVAIAVGRWSDRIRRRSPFLAASSGVAAVGLAAMAAATGPGVAVAGFLLYALGSATFIGLHSAFVMQMIVRPERRGRILGIVNLTNTVPALIGAGLAQLLARGGDFSTLMMALAAMTLAGGLATLAIREHRKA